MERNNTEKNKNIRIFTLQPDFETKGGRPDIVFKNLNFSSNTWYLLSTIRTSQLLLHSIEMGLGISYTG